jgi:hypothetical protein
MWEYLYNHIVKPYIEPYVGLYLAPCLGKITFSAVNLYYKGQIAWNRLYTYVCTSFFDTEKDVTLSTTVLHIKNNVSQTFTLKEAVADINILRDADLLFVQLYHNELDLKYDVLMGRYLNNNLNMVDLVPSTVNFWAIQFNRSDVCQIKIDFKRINYFVVGNVLFDRAFLTWYLRVYHGYELLTDVTDYSITFIDHNMDLRHLSSKQHVRIFLTDYIVEQS